MAKKSKKLTSVVIIAVCIGVVVGVKLVVGRSKGKLGGPSYTKVKGPKDAPIKITEFIDFQCPACAAGAVYIKQEMTRHPDLIRLTLKHFPLPMHAHGMLSAGYAECAVQQGKFWQFHDLLITRQNNWKQLDDARPAFQQIAKELDLDYETLRTCLEGKDVVKAIEKNRVEGQGLRIQSTPTYFVNGKMIVGQKSLEQEITKYLNDHHI